MDGNYGEIYHSGHYQQDIRDFSGRIAIERRELPRAGTNTIVYRKGRITREGSIRIAKVDSRFEALFLIYANKTTTERRADRGQGIDSFPDTQLLIRLDDPDSWGAEEIMLFGVKFWEIPIGFTQNDMVERDIPCTWHSEMLVSAIPRPHNKQGALAHLGPGDRTTWPAAGADPDPVI